MHQAVQRYSLGGNYQLSRGSLAGLGSGTGPSSAQITQQVGSIASTATMATMQALGMTGALIPIVGAAIAGIALGVTAILNSGCGDACIFTSIWANQAADLLEKNITAYFAIPEPRPVEAKAQALANFDRVWNSLVQQCSNLALSTAGENCISDRQNGACKWHQTGQPEFPGQPNFGECWNWFNSYRDPIANDPAVVTQSAIDSASGGSTGTTGGIFGTASGSGTSFDMSTLLLVAGAGILIAGLAGGN